MPYNKNYRPRKQRRGGFRINKRGVRAKFSWNDIAMGAQLGKLAYGMLNAELKHADTYITAGSVPVTGNVVSLVSTSQGTTDNTRDGNALRVKSFNINALYNFNPLTAQQGQTVRWALVHDTRVQVGTTAVLSDIYSVASGNAIVGMKNIDNQWKRFRILRSGKFTLDPNNIPERLVKCFHKISLPVRYDDSNQLIQNDILFVTWSDSSTNSPTLDLMSRMRFYDN